MFRTNLSQGRVSSVSPNLVSIPWWHENGTRHPPSPARVPVHGYICFYVLPGVYRFYWPCLSGTYSIETFPNPMARSTPCHSSASPLSSQPHIISSRALLFRRGTRRNNTTPPLAVSCEEAVMDELHRLTGSLPYGGIDGFERAGGFRKAWKFQISSHLQRLRRRQKV